jgi:adenosylmethionine-8-amino-7-oxononanoate aminotransferase
VGARCFVNGLVAYPGGGCADGTNGDNVMIAPPFVVTDDELREIVEILDRSLTESGL